MFDADYGDAEADAALAAAIEAAAGPEAVAAVNRRVVYGTPAKALLAATTGADLLVVGARGADGFRGLLLGSVSEQCLHHTARPLAIVRTGPPQDTTAGGRPGGEPSARVVVGIDGSDSSRRALQWSLEEGRLRRAEVDVVHAWAPPRLAAYPFAGLPLDAGALEKHARTLLDRFVDGQDLRGQPATVERILIEGRAAPAVLDTAIGADLVVLGTRGLGGFAGLLLGSVAHHVGYHARCPLVVVP
jgi:nucleotide-binding universal stress UspA family protein